MSAALPPVEFLPATAFALIDKHRPGGSSSSIGLVSYAGKTYLAKGDYFTTKPPSEQIKEILKEICSNDIYAYFGCHAQQLAVCKTLPWIMGTNCNVCLRGVWHDVIPAAGRCTNPVKCHLLCDCNGTHDVSPVELCGSAVGPHVLTQWINGFEPFGDGLVAQLIGATAHATDFIATVGAGGPGPATGSSDAGTVPATDLFVSVTLAGTAYKLPVRGIGNILAVALFLNDVDCIGNGGANVGFTVVRDADTGAPAFAKAVKIDPGFAFTGCVNINGSADPTVLSLQQAESLRFLRERGILVGTGKQSRYQQLPIAVQHEFLNTMRSIVHCSDPDVRCLFMRRGLEMMFADEVDVTLRQRFLVERRAAIAWTYAQEMSGSAWFAACAICHSAHANPSSSVADCLKARYCDSAKIRDPVTLEYHPLDQRFVNLNMLTLNNVFESLPAASEGKHSVQAQSGLTRSHLVDRDVLLNSFEAILAKKTPIDMKDLLAKCSGASKRVNIVGSAGIGKSTCCQAIVSCWASGTLFSEFELVLWVPLRNLTPSRYPDGDSYSVTDIIIRECIGMQPSPELRAAVSVLYSTSTVLWILDGYDEIVGRVPDHLSAVFGDMFSAPNRILTGRPNAMAGVSCDMKVEVAGFTDDNVREFVQRFERHSVPTGDITQAEASIASALRRSRVVWELAHIPVNLVLLCHVYGTAKGDLMRDNLSLTQLYNQVEHLLLKRYCARAHGRIIDASNLSDGQYHELTNDLVASFCCIAFVAMQTGFVMIPVHMVTAVLQSYCFTVTLDQLLLSGLVVAAGVNDGGSVQHVQFLHLTLQEYFAGKRVADLLMRRSGLATDSSDMAWLIENRDAPYFEVVWWFVAGWIKVANMIDLANFHPLEDCDLQTSIFCSVCYSNSAVSGLAHVNCWRCGESVCKVHCQLEVEGRWAA